MIADGVKAYINGREIMAPVKLENGKVSVLWDDRQKSARMVIR